MADRYWVGGSADWDGTAGTKWATTSGGSGGAAVPTSSDNVYFDAASGAVTINIASSAVCNDFINTGFTGTVTRSSGGITISGSAVLGSGATYTSFGTITFDASTTGKTITCNGNSWPSAITFNNASGEWTLQDNFTTTSNISFTAGSVKVNGKTVTANLFSSFSASSRTWTWSGGKAVLTGNNTTLWGSTGSYFADKGTLEFSYSGSTGTRVLSGFGTPGEAEAPNIKVTAGTDTVRANGLTCGDLDFTGFAGTWNNTFGMPDNIFGSFIVSSGMTVPSSGVIPLHATSGSWNIATNGKTIGSTIRLGGFSSGSATWTLQDNLTMGTNTMSQTNGTLTLNGKNLSCGVYTSNNSNTRTLNLGSGQLILTGTGTVFDIGAGSSMTINSGTSLIKINDASATNKTFTGAGFTYNNIYLTGAGTGKFIFTGSNTFAGIKCDTPPHTIQFESGTTTNISSLWEVSGTAGNLITIESSTTSPSTLNKTGGGTFSSDYLSISYSTATPSSTWYAGSHSTNGGNNSGWSFTDGPAAPQKLPKIADRVKQTSTTTGTGALVLDGAAPSSFFNFSDKFIHNDILAYGISLDSDLEFGIGRYDAFAGSISRDLVLVSTNSNAAVDWGAGSKIVWCDLVASLWGFDGTDGIEYYRRTADAIGWIIEGKKSRGNFHAPSTITTGDDLLLLRAFGYVGGTNKYIEAGEIVISSEGTISDAANGIGGKAVVRMRTSGGAIRTLFTVDSKGNVILGDGALSTDAADGFVYLPEMAGAPSGVPTSFTGRVPVVFDTTNQTFNFYVGGSWVSIATEESVNPDVGDVHYAF
jgi:hypothetical protein